MPDEPDEPDEPDAKEWKVDKIIGVKTLGGISAAAPTQMRPNGTHPCRPLARRRAAPGRHPACDLHDGAAGAHIHRSADDDLPTGGESIPSWL